MVFPKRTALPPHRHLEPPAGSARRGWALLVVLAMAVATQLHGAPSAAVLPPLTTLSNSPRLPGKFVWADLVTDDVAAVRKFYAGMFGWKFGELGGYTLAYKDEVPIAGMFQRPRPQDRSAEPRWIGYISVPNVDRAERAVNQAGGKVLAAPQAMPKRGEQAVFKDPEGALFGVIKSSSGDPKDFLAEPGEWIWIQLLSRDARKAAEFYRTIAGYEIEENTSPNRLSDFVLTSEGYARAVVSTIPDRAGKQEPTWLPFVRVTNVAESVTQAKALGGKVLIEPKAGLLAGKVAVVADPTGAAIGLLEWSEDLMKGGR
jgi:uncharacterized protein